MATKKSVNMNDYDIDAIDKKFEKLDRATIAKMTGTGSNLAKKKTTTQQFQQRCITKQIRKKKKNILKITMKILTETHFSLKHGTILYKEELI